MFEKINEEHIHKALENSAREDERAFESSKADRRYKMAYTVLGLIVFSGLTYYILPLDKELYKQLLHGLAVFLGGFGAGYGVRYWQG